MCPSAPRVCSEPGGQKPVLSLSLDRIITDMSIDIWSLIVAAYLMYESMSIDRIAYVRFVEGINPGY